MALTPELAAVIGDVFSLAGVAIMSLRAAGWVKRIGTTMGLTGQFQVNGKTTGVTPAWLTAAFLPILALCLSVGFGFLARHSNPAVHMSHEAFLALRIGAMAVWIVIQGLHLRGAETSLGR